MKAASQQDRLQAGWRRLRREKLTDEQAHAAVTRWARLLRIGHPVSLERVSAFHVTDEDGRPGCSLVGVTWNSWTACIYHTRRLTEEDIVHELLHVAFPHWSEEQVVAQTERIMIANRPEFVAASLRRRGVRRGVASVIAPTTSATGEALRIGSTRSW